MMSLFHFKRISLSINCCQLHLFARVYHKTVVFNGRSQLQVRCYNSIKYGSQTSFLQMLQRSKRWWVDIIRTNGKVKFLTKRSGFTLFAFTPFWKRKPDTNQEELSKDVLANIPKEVFRNDKLKSKPKRGIILRLLVNLWNVFTLFIRVVQVLCTFGPLLCIYPISYKSDSFKIKWWHWLLTLMEFTGPTFVKLGQWAGTRRDLFSSEFCDLCAKLHSNTKQHAFYITKRKLRKAFGKRWRHIFAKIEKEPIGSGCIAQVHRAYMAADMIPNESIVEEVLSLEDSDEPEIDFAEGFEIMGLHPINDYLERLEDRAAETPAPEKDSVIETGSGKLLDVESTVDPPKDSVEIIPHMSSTHVIQTEDEMLIPVAIKVLHPGVFRRVQRDLSILRFFAKIVHIFLPSTKWISLSESVEEFSDLMIRQIDLRFEAKCLEQFNENFEDNCHVRFPRPIRPYCKRDVLVETLEDGEPITNFLISDQDADNLDNMKVEDIRSRSEIREKIAAIGVDALLQMIFCNNFVHGDLHPGNILVQNGRQQLNQEDNKLMLVDVCDTVIVTTKPADSPIRLVLLDTGITTSLGEQDLHNFKNVFTAVVIGEGETVADLMLKHARYSECTDISGFKQDLGGIVMKFRQETIQLGKVQVGELLSQVFSTCSQYKVKMESNFASILIAIFVLEGLGRSLDPELDILEKAKPILLS